MHFLTFLLNYNEKKSELLLLLLLLTTQLRYFDQNRSDEFKGLENSPTHTTLK